MKHRGSFSHRMDAPDRHNGQRDERTDGRTDEETRLFVRPSVRLLDGVRHYIPGITDGPSLKPVK